MCISCGVLGCGRMDVLSSFSPTGCQIILSSCCFFPRTTSTPSCLLYQHPASAITPLCALPAPSFRAALQYTHTQMSCIVFHYVTHDSTGSRPELKSFWLDKPSRCCPPGSLLMSHCTYDMHMRLHPLYSALKQGKGRHLRFIHSNHWPYDAIWSEAVTLWYTPRC